MKLNNYSIKCTYLIRLLLFVTILIFINNFSAESKTIYWQKVGNLKGKVTALITKPTGEIFAAIQKEGIYRSSDNGNTWEQVNKGLTNLTVNAMAARANGDIFAGTNGGGMFVSKDNGQSWSEINEGLQSPYIVAVSINPNGHLYIATDVYSTVYRSTTSGQSWEERNNGIENISINNIAISSEGELFACTYSGMYFSRDNGNSWRAINQGLPEQKNIYSLVFVNKNLILIGSRNSKIYSSTSNGGSWRLASELKDSEQIFALLKAQNDELFAATFGRGAYRSTDNGQTWKQINGGLSNIQLLNIVQHPNGDLLAGTWGDGVFRGREVDFKVIAGGSYCAGQEISVTFTSSIIYDSNNNFRVELSDAEGNFDNPYLIGNLKSTTPGVVTGKLPRSLPPGNGYKIRVRASSPMMDSEESDETITILPSPEVEIFGKTTVCPTLRTTYYNKEKGHSTRWQVTGGTPVGGLQNDSLVVVWGQVGKGYITLVQCNTVTGCCDTLVKEISIEIPPGPIISRRLMDLVSSYPTGNQWYLDGKKIEGATDSIITPVETGFYTVQAIDSNGCVTAMSDPYWFDIESVEDDESYYQLSVYPNPADDRIKLEFYITNPTNISIRLLNLPGSTLYNYSNYYLPGNHQYIIDLSNFSNGFYLLEFNISGRKFYRKVIVQR
ncbi:MAG: YCF48-related protein [Candidatus Kapabacteria bacterium]|nr:YCF48-related protein [Candidatus Kapabacteria bacterium]